MATKLKVERIKRDWSQTEVAARTQNIVGQAKLSMIERGLKPDPREAAALAVAFGLPPDILFAEIGE